LTKYFVRVSAHNTMGYSDAISSEPNFIETSSQRLHVPTDISLSVSAMDVPNRLLVEWNHPSQDQLGFSTIPDSCGMGVGHTPDIATSYLIEWDTDMNLKSSRKYIAHVNNENDIEHCCPGSKCTVEVGTEVQSITISSPTIGELTKGGFRAIYMGPQRHTAIVIPTQGSVEVKIVSYVGTTQINIGDYIRIGGYTSVVNALAEATISLDSNYHPHADGTETVAYFSTPPATCFTP